MQISETRKGDLYILAQALLWGLFPIMSKLSIISIPPLVAYGYSTIFSILIFLFILLKRGRFKEIIKLSVIWNSFLTAFWIGFVFYGFYFFALKYTTAGNASIMALSETLWSFLFFNVWRKELLKNRHIWGIVLMVLGAIIILLPKADGFQIGDIILLFATAAAPLGNLFQKRAREEASSETILFLRTLFTLPMIGLFVYFSGETSLAVPDVKTMIVLFINGIFMLGVVKILWLEGVFRISVTRALGLSAIAPFVTLLVSFWFLGEKTTVWQFTSLVPMIVGMFLLLTDFNFKSKQDKIDSINHIEI